MAKLTEGTSYSIPFFLASVTLVVATMWALWDETIGRRPWKGYQRQYYLLKAEKIKDELDDARAAFQDPRVQREYAEVKAGLRSARERLAEPVVKRELRDLRRQRAELKERLRKSAFAERLAHARLQEREYLFRRTGDDEHLWKMKEYGAERQDAVATKEGMTRELTAIEERLASLTAERDRYSKELEQFSALGRIEALELRLAEVRSSKIRLFQDYIPALGTADRCRSCHLGIEDPVPISKEQPFAPHPGSYLFLRNHPPEQFGCTTCHRGQGRATSSPQKAHGWVEHWRAPMLKKRMVQATCQKCHERIQGLRGAERASEGRRSILKYGCYGCHKIAGFDGIRKVGPPLTEVASKINYSWLIRWLEDPSAMSPKARMPDFGLTEGERFAVADYLYSLTSDHRQDVPIGEVDWDLYDQGKVLWSVSRCSLCHSANGRGGAHERVHAPDLSTVGSKIKKEWLIRWLQDPKSYFPDTYMPKFRFSEDQVRALAEYLHGEFVNPDLEGVKETQPASGLITRESVRRGAEVIKKFGCFGCHEIRGMEDLEKIGPYLRQSELEEMVGAELSAIGSKPVEQLFFGTVRGVAHDRQTYLRIKLRTPRVFQDGLRMPKFPLTKEEIDSLTILLMGFTPSEIDTMPAQFRVIHRKEDYRATGEFAAVIADVNCLLCHTIRGAGIPFGPDLTLEGSRVRREWLSSFIMNPDFIRPLLKQMPKFHFRETTGMPGFGTDLDEVAVVTSYIKSNLVSTEIDENFLGNDPIVAADVVAGRELYRRNKCDFCHQIGDTGGALGPDLTLVGDRLTSGYIFAHLKDARRFVPGIVEPVYGFSDEEAMLITKFLMTLKEEREESRAR